MTIRIHFHRQDCLGEPIYKDHDTIVTHIEDAVQFAQNVLDNFNSMCFNGHELRILYVQLLGCPGYGTTGDIEPTWPGSDKAGETTEDGNIVWIQQ